MSRAFAFLISSFWRKGIFSTDSSRERAPRSMRIASLAVMISSMFFSASSFSILAIIGSFFLLSMCAMMKFRKCTTSAAVRTNDNAT